MQCGWHKEVLVKSLDSQAVKALLVSRALLVKIKRDLENQIRGLLKNLGLVIGLAKMNVFAVRAAEMTEDRPELAAAVVPLLSARAAIEQQIADLDRKVMRLARNNAQARRFMTAPGVGPITALCFLATIDDPTRFKRSRSVGAYFGLTTCRYASGEIDWTGRISKCGDKMLRSYLYEAVNVMLTRIARWSALKAWGIRVAKRRPRLPSLENRSAPDVDRRHRIQMVKGGRQSTCVAAQHSREERGKQRPCRTLRWCDRPGFAMLARANRASHIDPPASSYAIMRRACPYRGENPGPGKDVHGELDHRPGIREQNWLICDLARMSVFLVASWVRRTKLKTGSKSSLMTDFVEKRAG